MKKLISTLILVLLLMKLQAQCFTPIWTGNGLDQMNFYFTGATVNGIDLLAGNEIGIFDGNDCVGMGVLTQVLTPLNYLTFVASKDDPDTPAKDGFTEGHAISFRVCMNGGTVIVPNLTPTYASGTGLFVAGGTVVVRLSGITAPPGAPIPGTITQPTCDVASGSVVLEGLPATGIWTLTMNPGGITTPGSGINTTISSLSSGTYTFAVTDQLGATSDPSLEVIINTQPTLPLAAGLITGTSGVCQGQSGVAYSIPAIANATSYLWSYSGSGATITNGTTNSIMISFDATASPGNLTVRGVNICGNGTISANYPITVNAIPTITGVTSGSRCGPGDVVLSATTTAGVINWYTEMSGGTSVFTGTTFTTPIISTNTSYYVDATSNGCTSPTKTLVLAIVNEIPTIINTTPASRCGTGTVILGATPSAGTVSWYTVPSGGISVGTGTTLTTPDLSTNTTYWVDATNAGCTTPSRTVVIATVNPIPAITGTTPASRCGTGTVTLGATTSDGTINWYSSAIGGVSLGTGINFTTPPVSATTTYWVDATNLGCTSTPRTSVAATINPVPATPEHTVDCSLGFNHASVTVTSPVGAGYQYRLNSGNYQTSPVFTELINGSYTVTVVNSSNCTATGSSFDVSCGCVNGPTVTLGSVSGSTCGTAPITVVSNTFGGSATSVTIIENGAGTVSPAGTAATPFAFTYTPAAGDIGNTVSITVTTNNPLGAPCVAASATYTLTVNAIPTISGTTPSSRCGTGIVILGATPSAGTVSWYSGSTGGGSIGTGISFTTPVISATTTYYVDATNNGCTTAGRTSIIATVLQVPSPAGTISGPATFTPGTTGVTYSVPAITGATGYTWAYSGTGVIINGTGTSVTLDFAANATLGTLSVYGTNTCGQGTAATLTISPSVKTLTLTSVLLEGLYNGSGIMRQAQSATGAQWPAGVADHITVELHNGSNYATIVWSQTEVSLSTAGTAVITVPAIYSESYYITVKHRNSIETTTSSPVSFAGTVINRPFSSTASIYGANLRASGDGYFQIFGGDVNQDGYVDSGDYPDVVNDNFNYISGYLPTDINGDGFIDSGDYPIMVNNNLNYIGTIHP